MSQPMNHCSHSPASRRSAAAFSSCVTISSLCSLTSSGERAACQPKACKIRHICYENWSVYADMPLLFHSRSALIFRRDSRPCAHRAHTLALPDPHQAILQPKIHQIMDRACVCKQKLAFQVGHSADCKHFSKQKRNKNKTPFELV